MRQPSAQWRRHRQRPRRDCPLRPFQFPNFAWLIGDHLQIQGTRTLPRYQTHWCLCQIQSNESRNLFWKFLKFQFSIFQKEANISNHCLKVSWMIETTDERANGLAMYYHQIKIGDPFVLNTYNSKICIKIIFKRNWLKSSPPAAHAFWADFCSSRRPWHISPMAEKSIFFLIETVTQINLEPKTFTVKKIGHGLEHVKTNLRFFGLSLNFYSNF